ncbi:MAG: hypothetical protein HKM98_09905 [Gammaproteobacteria bacterium]|nr:hypothetical protein [Gammaproteobacteria bacterium]
MMQKLITLGLITFALLAVSNAIFADDREEIAAIKQQLQSLTKRLAALESNAVSSAESRTTMEKPEAADRVRINGNFRYRHEGIDEETRPERWRQRVRARVGLVANVTDTAEVGVQLASGSDDPLSTNQTLDSGASTKGLNLDLAYFALTSQAGNKLIGGKMKNPLFRPGKSALIWDGDLNPEGLAWQYSAGDFFGNVVGFWLEERSSSADSIMLGGQAGIKTSLSNGAKITAGVGYYDYAVTQGRAPFFDGDARGNTLDGTGNYAFDFEILEVFAELSTRLGNMPFSVFADWARNGAAGPQDTAMSVGAKFGKASAPNSWEFGYTYKDVEADALVGSFTDSDFGGGGTSVSGHALNMGYAFSKRIKGSLTYMLSENRIGTPAERDYNRLQADFSLKY